MIGHEHPRRRTRRITKLDRAPGVVNLALALGLAALAACTPPREPAPIDWVTGDWHTVLGNVQRAGYAAEIAPDETEIAWRSEVGRGLVTPLLVDGPLVLAATTTGEVAAVSVETGETYWKRGLDGAVSGGIVRAGDRILTATEQKSGKAYALTLRSGDRVWERTIGSSPYSPVIVGDAMYVGTEGGNVYALDARNGEELWHTELSGAAASTPVPHGRKLLVPTKTDTLYRLDRIRGAIEERAALPAAVSASPTLIGDTLVVPVRSGGAVAFVVPTMEKAWHAALDEPVLAAPVAGPDGSIYLLDRSAQVWRLAPGDRSPQRLAALGGAARGSFTLARERMLVGRLDGALFLLGMDGEVIWKRDLEESIAAPATVRDGAIYVPLLGGNIVQLK